MSEIKISVIIPIYNVADYLDKCLSSVVGQTYPNLEIICVNDGSTDNSGDILDQFAKRDHRIIAIHQQNKGVSAARNIALDKCTGDFIGFVDGDDWLESNMYQILADNVTGDDIDISACGYFEDYGDVCRQVKNALPVPEHPEDTRKFLEYVYIRDQYRGVASYLCTRIFRRNVIEEASIRFDNSIHISEDMLFAAQCYVNSRKSIYTSIPLYHYVQHEGSAMHDAARRLDGFGSCVAFQKIIDLYENCHVDESIVDYVKRFYVYHASILLKLAFEHHAEDKVDPLKANIQKYFDVYCRTNREHPEWIEELKNLLHRK